MPNLNKVLIATIANGAAVSDILTAWPARVSAIVMPAAWTAAGMTFQGSMDGVTFFDVFNDAGDEYMVPVLVSQAVILNVPLTFPFIKVRSGVTATPVNQGAARSVSLICTGS